MIQYGDDYGVKKLAQQFHPNGEAVFIDAKNFDDMNYCERKIIHMDLALGMASEENSLQRLQIIKGVQTQLTQEITAGVASGALTPAAFKKMRRPYEDMLYVLGVKDCNTYLPTEEEVMQMVEQSQKAQSQQGPSPDQIKAQAQAGLDQARTQEIMAKLQGQHPEAVKAIAQANKDNADVSGTSASRQLEALSLTKGKATNY